MKRLITLLLCLVLFASCGGDAARVDELQKKNDDLTQRVKNLEDHLLEAQKQLIAQKQALQTISARQRDMENYFNRLQAGQGR